MLPTQYQNGSKPTPIQFKINVKSIAVRSRDRSNLHPFWARSEFSFNLHPIEIQFLSILKSICTTLIALRATCELETHLTPNPKPIWFDLNQIANHFRPVRLKFDFDYPFPWICHGGSKIATIFQTRLIKGSSGQLQASPENQPGPGQNLLRSIWCQWCCERCRNNTYVAPIDQW